MSRFFVNVKQIHNANHVQNVADFNILFRVRQISFETACQYDKNVLKLVKITTTNEQIVVNLRKSVSFRQNATYITYIGANLMCITKRKVTKIDTIDKL